MLRHSIIVLLTALALGGIAKSQSPTPVIVQAANQPATRVLSGAEGSTSSKSGAAATTDAQSISAAIKLLEEIKSLNDDVLAKQKGALERLDELQQSADQLQIFAKRG